MNAAVDQPADQDIAAIMQGLAQAQVAEADFPGAGSSRLGLLGALGFDLPAAARQGQWSDGAGPMGWLASAIYGLFTVG